MEIFAIRDLFIMIFQVSIQIILSFYNCFRSMLNSSPDSLRLAKVNECIMRRKARNLRAKVKALLPVQTCCKHDNRNRCVHEMEDNRMLWTKFSKKRNWTSSKEKENHYFYENNTNSGNQERFEKLTEAQIQQIKQDKLYYLGQDNIADFEEFLRNKDRVCKSAFQLLMNAFLKEFPMQRMHFELQSKDLVKKKMSQTFTEESAVSLMNTRHVKKATVTDKLRDFQERRKIIECEEKSKRVMNKVKLQMRLERAEAKLEEIKYKKMSEMGNKRDFMDSRFQKVQKKRENTVKKGQIKGIEEEIRRTFLSKMNKTNVQQCSSKTARAMLSNFSTP